MGRTGDYAVIGAEPVRQPEAQGSHAGMEPVVPTSKTIQNTGKNNVRLQTARAAATAAFWIERRCRNIR